MANEKQTPTEEEKDLMVKSILSAEERGVQGQILIPQGDWLEEYQRKKHESGRTKRG